MMFVWSAAAKTMLFLASGRVLYCGVGYSTNNVIKPARGSLDNIFHWFRGRARVGQRDPWTEKGGGGVRAVWMNRW